jgi:branched-chain amino acid aminotransferase
MPPEFENFQDILSQAYRLGGQEDFTARLTVSRGPGSFSVNPYDSIGGSQLYLITTKLKRPAPQAYLNGVSLATAPFPAKSEYAGIKTCDYLHNVLAKKSALDKGADYVVSFDQEGFLTEGATENVAIVTKDGHMRVPSFSRILKGVTLMRVMALAEALVEKGLLKSVMSSDLTEKEAKSQAAEVILTTTSFDVLAVSRWDGQPVGSGAAGPVARELLGLIEAEINGNGPYVTNLA